MKAISKCYLEELLSIKLSFNLYSGTFFSETLTFIVVYF